MTFAIPITDAAAIRCRAIIDRLVNQRPGTRLYDEAWRHGSSWLDSGEAMRHPHPAIAFDGDAVIRALVEDPHNEDWLEKGADWLTQFEGARRAQGFYRASVICLPECRDTADLVAANID